MKIRSIEVEYDDGSRQTFYPQRNSLKPITQADIDAAVVALHERKARQEFAAPDVDTIQP
jgi:hypothetical protein